MSGDFVLGLRLGVIEDSSKLDGQLIAALHEGLRVSQIPEGILETHEQFRKEEGKFGLDEDIPAAEMKHQLLQHQTHLLPAFGDGQLPRGVLDSDRLQCMRGIQQMGIHGLCARWEFDAIGDLETEHP
ncbi:hypothetical protein KKD52_16955 [Myxococcota bacterium]|nr:hypothetical protein [Myxococcota bacterium]MBU1411918.1 hypothetical protein [Myxococcota bacterium]MBU1512045.1 hypothetical protein [Myxococcota bacterium]